MKPVIVKNTISAVLTDMRFLKGYDFIKSIKIGPYLWYQYNSVFFVIFAHDKIING